MDTRGGTVLGSKADTTDKDIDSLSKGQFE